ncbi:hypothetical protein Aph02nite_00230 [Actinoplanes philippinensis]|uniref:Chlorophyllase enzyme n=1 Tax=Actinoplanes philippinensis TaxID=35752 RepID=A0A1I2HLR9_9ACTN|nr:hypothetical protein [Actinoplanes philippinensis]GIE74073.1 hypothetical protein Aph02nite_00230 [Actinoplanes philippinensis]SFF30210.1 hypothetical protein SAMN05421541_108283 [Actinoplanes philippinensis]
MRKRKIAGAVVLALSAAAAVTVMAIRGPEAEATAAATTVRAVEYDLGIAAFTDAPDWGGTSELKAIVHYPDRMAGKLPVVVMLHGQQLSCYSADEDDWEWPCPRGVRPYPSHRGYDYLADALVRKGFVVVSVSANGLNANMGTAPERAHLLNRHLTMLQQLTTTGRGPLAGRFTDAATGRRSTVDFRGHLDLTRVGTLGHSVAGEGVYYQAADAHRRELPAGVRIRGVVAVAARNSRMNDITVTTAPVAVLSAECWGDGDHAFYQAAKDHHGTRGFLVDIAKANHNYFNTEWTTGPGPSDGDDTECPTAQGRPTAAQQQGFAVDYLTAFYAYALQGDTRAEPVLTGEHPLKGVTTRIEDFG